MDRSGHTYPESRTGFDEGLLARQELWDILYEIKKLHALSSDSTMSGAEAKSLALRERRRGVTHLLP